MKGVTMIDERIEKALSSNAPVQELRNLASHLLAQGQTRHTLRQADREAEEDAVMDVMDVLVGWCSPHMKLPPEQPTSGGRS
jgi:hypothetical protein